MNKRANNITLAKSLTLSIVFLLLGVASGNGSSSSNSSSSSSSSPYSNKSLALSRCSSELRSDTNSGYYDHLSDYEMRRKMDQDLEDCMAGYGHYP